MNLVVSGLAWGMEQEARSQHPEFGRDYLRFDQFYD